MTYVTEHTSWPTSTTIAAETKALIDLFFTLADLNAPEAGPRLADEIFTADGEMVSSTGTAKGSAAIAKSRERAWDVVTARRHEVIKVYAHDAAGTDLLLIGRVAATVKNGNVAEVHFCSRVAAAETERGLRMESYQVWADMSPVANAMK